eukprot:Phypoly_transcript_16469.p1 GENE.Phypoly_transcript_16469~~Phypoly_transcript_16469.p1  ORF type:complete len:256 (+),score=26.66 Phypoly_transcript_16469:79-846(+)
MFNFCFQRVKPNVEDEDAEGWLRILEYTLQLNMFAFLSGKDLVCLASTSTKFMNILKIRINQKCVFKQESFNNKQFAFYKPNNLSKVTNVTSLQDNLKSLKFHSGFNSMINLARLDSLTMVTFGYSFNLPVDGLLPNSLIHLTFGFCFDRPVTSLPLSLTHLTFGYSFDQPISSLPLSLTHLALGEKFNHPVDSLPLCLTHLVLKTVWSPGTLHPLTNIPSTLVSLSIKRARYLEQNKALQCNIPKKCTIHFIDT